MNILSPDVKTRAFSNLSFCFIGFVHAGGTKERPRAAHLKETKSLPLRRQDSRIRKNAETPRV